MEERDTKDNEIGEGDNANNHDLDEEGSQEEKKPQNEYEKRLFDLRMKMNQARKANRTVVEEEFQQLNRKGGKNRYKNENESEDDDGDEKNDSERKSKTAGKNKKKEDSNATEKLLDTSFADAEWINARNRQKEETAATYGLNAFTRDAYYRAYEKRVDKLEKRSADEQTSSSLEINPFDYGRVNVEASEEALDRLRKDVLRSENQRKKFSRRRMHTDAEDVDYINDKNAQFNKKLKRAFDKYTVEIRQNLERGTAI